MSDVVQVRGLRLLAHVGVPEAERATAQPVEIDLDIEIDLARAGTSDAVADTVDYAVVADAVAAAVTAAPVALLERMATVATRAALDVDERIAAVDVTVRKLRPPVAHDVRTTAVRIRRERS